MSAEYNDYELGVEAEMPRDGYGNVYQNDRARMLSWLLALNVTVMIAVGGWGINRLVALEEEVAELKATVNILVADRKPVYRGGANGP